MMHPDVWDEMEGLSWWRRWATYALLGVLLVVCLLLTVFGRWDEEPT